jgi:hypothetical protein
MNRIEIDEAMEGNTLKPWIVRHAVKSKILSDGMSCSKT